MLIFPYQISYFTAAPIPQHKRNKVYVYRENKYLAPSKKWINKTIELADGNHRALVYGVRLALDKEKYQPVKALHATSWDIADGILGHPCQASDNLEHGGRFPIDGGVNESVEKRNHYYKNGFHAPIRRAVSF